MENLLRLNEPLSGFHSFSGEDGAPAQLSSANKDLDLEAGQVDSNSETSNVALQDITLKCGTKVLFAGEKIGEEIGRTRREAKQQVVEGSHLFLAGKIQMLISKYLKQLRCFIIPFDL